MPQDVTSLKHTGQLGAGRAANSVIPHHFALPTQAVLSAVAAGWSHSLAMDG